MNLGMPKVNSAEAMRKQFPLRRRLKTEKKGMPKVALKL